MDELDEPISDSIIREALPDIKVLTYDELGNFLDFDDKGRLVLLYLTGENYGHWVCLFKHNEIITFHDSYGYKPDSQLKWLQRKTKPKLTQLLKQSGCTVVYNPYKLQRDGNKIATCGKHAVHRLRHMEMSVDDYANFVIKNGGDYFIEREWEKMFPNDDHDT